MINNIIFSITNDEVDNQSDKKLQRLNFLHFLPCLGQVNALLAVVIPCCRD